MSTDYTEPFAYGIQAPIGSVTPLFHKRKDAEDYIAKLTDSRDAAKIIPLYRASTTIETMLECWHRLVVKNDELYAEIARLRSEAVALRSLEASMATAEVQTEIDYQAEIERLRLTDAEREAVGVAANLANSESFRHKSEASPVYAGHFEKIAATLRGLLERTKWKRPLAQEERITKLENRSGG